MFRSSKKLLCCKIIFDNLYQMNKGERTLIVVKPDGIVKKKVGEIIKRIEEGGLDMVGAKFLKTDKDMIEKHYTLDPEWIEKVGKKAISSYEKKGLKPPSNDAKKIGRAVLKNLQKYLTEGPVFMALFEGENGVARPYTCLGFARGSREGDRVVVWTLSIGGRRTMSIRDKYMYKRTRRCLFLASCFVIVNAW